MSKWRWKTKEKSLNYLFKYFFCVRRDTHFRFSLVYDHLIEFNQLALANAEGSDDMLNRVMTKDNIGLAALLETKEAAWSNGMLLLAKCRHLTPPSAPHFTPPSLMCCFPSRDPAGSVTDSPAAAGLHGAHPLGSAVLWRQASADHDADEWSWFSVSQIGRSIFWWLTPSVVVVLTVEAANAGCGRPFVPARPQSRPFAHAIAPLRWLQLAARFRCDRVPKLVANRGQPSGF